MNSIIDNQRPILLSVEGTNIWSGQQPQQYNSQAIAWGGLRCLFFQSSPSKFVDDHFNSHQLFAVGKRYQFVAWAYLIGFMVPVPFWIMYRLWPKLRTDYLYTPVIWCVEHIPFITICWSIYGSYYIGWLCVGINSSILSFFSVAFLSQWWLRTRYPRWFNKYNYVVAAALDGGTQVMVFILSFAVQGASGESHLFTQWWVFFSLSSSLSRLIRFLFLGGAPIKQVSLKRIVFVQIYWLQTKFLGNYDRCALIPSP